MSNIMRRRRQSAALEKEEQNQEFTCEICAETTSIMEKKFTNGGRCRHPFCTDCIVRYIRVRVNDDNVGEIQCPSLNCPQTLDPPACASLVGDALFVRWCDVLCEAAVMAMNGCYCPYRNCNALIVNECGDNPQRWTCPKCKRLFCFECRMGWHAGFGCEEVRERMDPDGAALVRLAAREQWQRCPRCRRYVELNGGCNNVRCRCGQRFCYKCGKVCRCRRPVRMFELFGLLLTVQLLVMAAFFYRSAPWTVLIFALWAGIWC